MNRLLLLVCGLALGIAACGDDSPETVRGDGAAGSGSGAAGGTGGIGGDECDAPDHDGDGDGFDAIACGGHDCDDRWAAVHPGAEEICDGVDQNCDGTIDEGCPADGDERACYGGPDDTAGVGICTAGVQRAQNGVWGPCEGAVLPAEEICGDGVDSDCNGRGASRENEDGGCCVPVEEICNGVDDDCDGAIDEGLVDVWNTCGHARHVFTATTPADCAAAGRTCEGIAPVPGAADAMSIELRPHEVPSSVFFFINPGGGTVTFGRIDTRTLTVAWSQPAPLGFNPGVIEPDGGVWAQTWLGATRGLVHLGPAGERLCELPLPAEMLFTPPRTSGDGDVWFVGSVLDGNRQNLFRFWKVDTAHVGDVTEPGATPPCVLEDLSPGDPEGTHFPPGPGLAVGGARGWQLQPQAVMDWLGNIWFLSANTLQSAITDRLATPTMTLHSTGGLYPIAHALPSPLGGVIAAANPGDTVWLPGDAPLGTVTRLDVPMSTANAPMYLSPDAAALWFSGLTNDTYSIAYRYDIATGTLTEHPGHDTIELVDAQGRLWERRRGPGVATEYLVTDMVTGATQIVPLAPAGSNSGLVGATNQPWFRKASWNERFDAGPGGGRWEVLRWQETLWDGASAEAWVGFVDRNGRLEAPRCGPFRGGTAALHECPGADGPRYTEVEFRLRGSAIGAQPVVSNIELEWSEP